jgi:hypothetical protein
MLISIRSRAWLLALVTPILAIPAQAAEVNKYLPSDADCILVLNVKQLVNSALVQKHAAAELKTMMSGNSAVTKHLNALGFDPLKDLTSVTFALSLGKDPKLFAVAEGSFDVAKFEQQGAEVAKDKAGTLKVHKEGTRTLYEVKVEQLSPDKPLFVTFIDNATIAAASDRHYLIDTLNKAKGSKLKKDLQELIEKADGQQSIWFALPASSLLNSDAANVPDAKKIIERMANVTGGLAIHKDVKLQVDIVAKDADAAKEIAEKVKEGLDQAKGMAAILASNQKELAPATEVMDALKVETAGNTVSIKAHASEDAIEKALKNK